MHFKFEILAEQRTEGWKQNNMKVDLTQNDQSIMVLSVISIYYYTISLTNLFALTITVNFALKSRLEPCGVSPHSTHSFCP